ncbi:preprotein translocase subunit SecG [Helicobacter sp. T3_23-1056]
MSTVFVVIEIILSIVIVGVVLLQKSSNLGLGVYSGSNESLFGAKGPAGFLAKFTMFLGLLFLANTIFLGYQFNAQQEKSVFDKEKESTAKTTTPLNAPLNAPLNSPLNSPLSPSLNAPLESSTPNKSTNNPSNNSTNNSPQNNAQGGK